MRIRLSQNGPTRLPEMGASTDVHHREKVYLKLFHVAVAVLGMGKPEDYGVELISPVLKMGRLAYPKWAHPPMCRIAKRCTYRRVHIVVRSIGIGSA